MTLNNPGFKIRTTAEEEALIREGANLTHSSITTFLISTAIDRVGSIKRSKSINEAKVRGYSNIKLDTKAYLKGLFEKHMKSYQKHIKNHQKEAKEELEVFKEKVIKELSEELDNHMLSLKKDILAFGKKREVYWRESIKSEFIKLSKIMEESKRDKVY